MVKSEEVGTAVGLFEDGEGVSPSGVDVELTTLLTAADGVGGVKGDNAGAGSWSKEDSATGGSPNDCGIIRGANSQSRTTISTMSDPDTKNTAPKRCAFVMDYLEMLPVSFAGIIARELTVNS